MTVQVAGWDSNPHSIAEQRSFTDGRIVVLVRVVNSMVEFKQFVGRGPRVREDYGKLWFNILDCAGAATHNFADQGFDGLRNAVNQLQSLLNAAESM